jgi:hypothetical protein
MLYASGKRVRVDRTDRGAPAQNASESSAAGQTSRPPAVELHELAARFREQHQIRHRAPARQLTPR